MSARSLLVTRLHRMWQGKGAISTMLLPLSWLARLVIAWKQYRYRLPHRAGRCAIVVVGNLYVGGTGKTPVVIAVVHALQAFGWTPGVISRGYGAALRDHAKVGQGDVDAGEFGDEPALIARETQAAVAVHPKRLLALEALLQRYPAIDVVVADDGLQHRALGRDIEIVVQDERGIGNGRVLPAGPLREPAHRLDSVDYLVTNRTAGPPPPGRTGVRTQAIRARQLDFRLVPADIVHLNSGRSLAWPQWQANYGTCSTSAVAGIGQPDRFFTMLREASINLDQAIALPDHYRYRRSPFTALTSRLILITGKDAVKCRGFHDERLWVVKVTALFSDSSWLDGLDRQLRAIAQEINIDN